MTWSVDAHTMRVMADDGLRQDGDALAAGAGEVDLGFEPSDVEDLLRVQMPFGRCRGRAIIDLPEEYLLWFERESFPAGRLGRLMKLALGIKRYGAESVVKNLRRVGSFSVAGDEEVLRDAREGGSDRRDLET